jgi:hypothetical protein
MVGVTSRSTITTPDLVRGGVVLDKQISGSSRWGNEEDDVAVIVADEEIWLQVMLFLPLNIEGYLVMGHNMAE